MTAYAVSGSYFLHYKGDFYISAVLSDNTVLDNRGLVHHIQPTNVSHRFRCLVHCILGCILPTGWGNAHQFDNLYHGYL